MMHCFIYKSKLKDGLYLYINRKDDFSQVPATLYRQFGEPIFVMDIELSPGRKLARESIELVMNNLKNKGFHVQLPPSRFSNTGKIH